jgi:hypothetical protein
MTFTGLLASKPLTGLPLAMGSSAGRAPGRDFFAISAF